MTHNVTKSDMSYAEWVQGFKPAEAAMAASMSRRGLSHRVSDRQQLREEIDTRPWRQG